MREIHKALDILGLPVLITKDDIKRRYLQLAKRHHPDIGGDSKKMEEINRAYEILISYINGFRYSFDENEIRKRYPDIRHKDIFKPFEFDEK